MPASTRFLTVVLELPDNPAVKRDVLDALPLFGQFKGANITGVAAGDAVTESELLEQIVHPKELRPILEQANHPRPPQMSFKA